MTLDPILQAVRQAALLCREVQHHSLRSMNKVNEVKQDTEPVTLADYGAQAIIGRTLAEHFPDDAVIAEESGTQFLGLTTDKQKAEIINLLTTVLDVNVTQDQIVAWLDHGKGKTAARTWVIDPIDGTKGFVAMRHYAIGVGIVENGQPTGAVIAAPGYGDGVSGADDGGALFYVRDGRAYQEFLSGGDAQPIQVSQRSDGAIKFVESFEKKHASKARMNRVREYAGLQSGDVVALDSMEKYALVANGDADVYLRLPNLDSTRPHMVWDHAAGTALVLAAGGKVTDPEGQPLDFSQGNTLPNRGMIVSNGLLHDDLLRAVQQLLTAEASEENN